MNNDDNYSSRDDEKGKRNTKKGVKKCLHYTGVLNHLPYLLSISVYMAVKKDFWRIIWRP